jgi:hypothetical protein
MINLKWLDRAANVALGANGGNDLLTFTNKNFHSGNSPLHDPFIIR